MRTDNINFALAWRKDSIAAQFVFKLDFGGNDFIYLTSGVIDGLSGTNVYTSCLNADISGTSQKISPEKSVSTIGEITFSCLDDGLTQLQKSKLLARKGLRNKRVVFYVGEAGFSWSNFVIATTQVIKSCEYKDGIYTYSCADVQRELRQEIFDVKKTTLSASIAENATTIPVYGTTGFQLVRQPASPTGIVDAAGQKVGYIKLSNGCIVRYTGLTGNSFTGCTWGVLNSAHLIAPIDKDDDSNADNAPKIEEYVYREGPAVMLAYELMTGYCWGFAGDRLPDHWNMNIDPSLIRTSDFQFIGVDWWDITNNDKGVAAVISGVTKTDGKKFIEEQILTMLGAFSPIYANGEMGLKRLSVVHSGGSYTRLLTQGDVTEYGSLTHDMESVINQITIKWNYVPEKKDFTRVTILRDTVSQQTHGTAKPKELAFKTLASSRHSYDVLKSRFDSLRDRFAGPPIKIKVSLLPRHNDLEVGDVIRLRLPNVRDYTGDVTTLDRNFEIQQVATDWKTGAVSLDLFGSSQPASAISEGSGNEPATALPDAWYTSAGTAINATNFPGKITMVSGLTRISANMTLTGNATALTVYYVNGDLTIDAGVIVTITHNVMLRVKGFLQVNGKINGRAQGAGGQTGSIGVSAQYIGNTLAGDGVTLDTTTSFLFTAEPYPAYTLNGKALDYAPYLTLSTANNTLTGLPTNLRGSPGPMGGRLFLNPSSGWNGGAGGSGGAGLAIVCRGGDIGAAGVIDTSGNDGFLGGKLALSAFPGYMMSGAGGGGFPGAVYWLIDGATNNAPSLNNANSVAEVGISPLTGARYVLANSQTLVNLQRVFGWTPNIDDAVAAQKIGSFATRENTYQVNHRIQFLTGESTANADIGFANPAAAIYLSEAPNTPATAMGNLSTIEVSVSPPVGDTNYAYSYISYRKRDAIGWFDVGPAAPEALITVPSDGTEYDVRAQSVNKAGQRSEAFIFARITVVNITAEYASILLLDTPAYQLKGGGTTFDGRDAHFIFTDSNFQNQHFAYYEVKVYAGSTLLRTEQISDRAWSYTSEKNLEDGNNRSFTVKVAAVGIRGQKTAEVSLAVSNPAPTSTLNTAVPGFRMFKLYMTQITDSDFLGYKVYASTTNGFTPGSGNLVYQGTNNPITLDNLGTNTTYYYRIRAYDAFGDGTLEVQRSIVTDGGLSFEYLDGEVPVGEILEVNGNIVVDRGNAQVSIGPTDQTSYYSLMYVKLATAIIFDVRENADIILGDTTSNNYVMWDQSENTLIVRGNVAATSVAASVSISAPTITGGSISGNSISGGTIDGTTITGGTIRTAASGQRLELLGADNKLHGYWDSGDGTVRDNLTVGAVAGAGFVWGITIGNVNYQQGGIYLEHDPGANGDYGILITNFDKGVWANAYGRAIGGYSTGDNGVQGESTHASSYGVRGINNYSGATSAAGVSGESTYGVGVRASCGSSGKAPLKIVAASSSAAPSHTPDIGSIWVSSVGNIYIYTNVGWKEIALISGQVPH